MEEQEEYYIEQIREYFHNQCGLNKMEVDKPENQPKLEEAELELEEEKVDTSVNEKPQELKKIDPTLIPTNLYLITSDYFFTLPKFWKTLEQLTKEYYSKKCSLCKKITKRGSICLMCKEYMCVAKCNLEKSLNNYKVGNLTMHSRRWGAGYSVFLGPVEGQLVYIFNGLAIEAKSPYVDKYGECFDEKEKRYETYNLNDADYNQVRDHFLEFEIPNYIVNKRANKSKVYKQNVL